MVRHIFSIVGAGRVATALGTELYDAGFRIEKIVSRTRENAQLLAEKCHAEWSMLAEFEGKTDIIIVAVPDHMLQEVLSQIKCNENTLVAHTAGSCDLTLFPAHIRRKGVFYPLQTFTKGRKISFLDLPVFIEASDKDTENTLTYLAEELGGKVFVSDSEKRRRLHLAAVFVCNFTNHMLTAGKALTASAEMSFNVLDPLIRETLEKALDTGPELSQTGPAVRNDMATIKKHLDLLSFSQEFQDIYRSVTRSIIEYHKSDT